MYSSGLKLGSAAIFNQNLFFEMASSNRMKSFLPNQQVNLSTNQPIL